MSDQDQKHNPIDALRALAVTTPIPERQRFNYQHIILCGLGFFDRVCIGTVAWSDDEPEKLVYDFDIPEILRKALNDATNEMIDHSVDLTKYQLNCGLRESATSWIQFSETHHCRAESVSEALRSMHEYALEHSMWRNPAKAFANRDATPDQS